MESWRGRLYYRGPVRSREIELRRRFAIRIAAVALAAAGGACAMVLLAGCDRSSRADRILGDEELFYDAVFQAVEYARDECPAFARSARVHTEQAGAISMQAALSAAVPEGHRPELAGVTSRHGAPDSTSGDVRYYDDIGLRADSLGAVVEIVIPCKGSARREG